MGDYQQRESFVKQSETNATLDSFQDFDRLPGSVAWRQRFAFILLLVERLWPLILPLILLNFAFLSTVWFGIFLLLPPWLHAVLLLIFSLIAFWFLSRFLTVRLPLLHEVNRHIEQKNGLAFQPLFVQCDDLAFAEATGTALWQEHRRRMRQQLQNLRIGMPKPQVPKRDPYAVRSVFFLSFFIAFAYSFSPGAGQLKDAFTFSFVSASPQLARIDGWIDLPDYTGMAPIYLNFNQEGEERRTVPANSVVHFRITDKHNNSHLWQLNKDSSRIAVEPIISSSSEESIIFYQVPLIEDTGLQLVAAPQTKNWLFTIIADQPPQINWASIPRRALNGTLEMAYQIDDDYDATKAWAEITALEQEKASQALYEAPKFSLTLPRKGKEKASHKQNLTHHPWAGMEVEITLYVEDGAGQVGASQPVTLTLPQHAFGNPLARAVVEQRRLLVQGSDHREQVLDMLAALLIRPQDTVRNATHVIALQSAWTRLSYIGRNDHEKLRAMADYLWQIALAIEDDGLNEAQRRLKQAQQALRNALREGASEQEIERLMQELRQAMQDYVASLAETQASNPLSGDAGERSLLGSDDLEKRLQQLEEMAKLGARGAAEQLLSELENLLDNLQIVQGNNGEGQSTRSDRSTMQQSMDQLADMLRRQQEMMNETDRLNQEWSRGEQTNENYREKMEGLAERQEGLRGEWESLAQSLQQEGGEVGESMGEAGQEMGQARDSLNNGDGLNATGSQGRALEAMRRAGQGMMQAMREQMGEQSGQSNNVDPLGRERANGQASHDSDVKIPSQMDVERARRILDEIRNRLEHMTPQLERQYLERLLEFN